MFDYHAIPTTLLGMKRAGKRIGKWAERSGRPFQVICLLVGSLSLISGCEPTPDYSQPANWDVKGNGSVETLNGDVALSWDHESDNSELQVGWPSRLGPNANGIAPSRGSTSTFLGMVECRLRFGVGQLSLATVLR